jgi:CRP/FNR family cyclic AMP-dependent transcriptional regulator
VGGAEVRSVSLCEHDPGLFAGLSDTALLDARDAIVPAWTIAEGEGLSPVDRNHAPFGLLLARGWLAREVAVTGTSSIEVLGPGDVLRPWVEPGSSGIVVQVGWKTVAPSLVAALDVRFGSVALRHPMIISTLMDRYVRRSQWLGVQLAVCHIVGLDKRLETMLWHLAGRWGKVTPDGVILPFRFNHGTLAQLVGVRRPSVTSSISRLRQAGVLTRRDDGCWVLSGSPPNELADPDESQLSSSR